MIKPILSEAELHAEQDCANKIVMSKKISSYSVVKNKERREK